MRNETVKIVCADGKNDYVFGIRGKVVNDESIDNKWTFKDNDSNWESEELAVVIDDMLYELKQSGLQQGEEFEVIIRRKQQ